MQEEARRGLLIAAEAAHAGIHRGPHLHSDRRITPTTANSCSPAWSTSAQPAASRRYTPEALPVTPTSSPAFPSRLPFRPAARHARAARPRRPDRPPWWAPPAKRFSRQVRPREGAVPLGPRGQEDVNSSCWLRVATYWAGKQWGADPHSAHRPGSDRRFSGRRSRPAHHRGQRLQRRQMPPYTLPDNKTQSGIKSRSSLKGGARTITTRSASKTRREASTSASTRKRISRPW